MGSAVSSTRLARLHPYPAMVADELAVSLSQSLIKPGAVVLDPFCGSGRFLTGAVSIAGERVGFDINPLACLITRAKLSTVSRRALSDFVSSLPEDSEHLPTAMDFEIQHVRKVEWFSRRALTELSGIVEAINRSDLATSERELAASVLSATTRQCSFARTDSWKLHRIPAEQRRAHARSPLSVFRKRVNDCINELKIADEVKCSSSIFNHSFLENAASMAGSVDLVMTSPPYGDSKTTVQYGAVSDLSLSVLKHVRGLRIKTPPPGQIDRECLGGKVRRHLYDLDIKRFWAGSQHSEYAHRLRSFLRDYADHCAGIALALKPGGIAVFVLSRRSLGGFRVKLDAFTTHVLEQQGTVLLNSETRAVLGKRLPYRINRFAAAKDGAKSAAGARPTMNEEQILYFSKTDMGS